MVRAAILFATVAVLVGPALGARSKPKSAEEAHLDTNVKAELGALGSKNFFWRTRGTPCFAAKGNKCADGLQKAPVDTLEDCEAALKALTADGSEFQKRSVSDLSDLAGKVDSLQNKRGCIVRTTNGGTVKFLNWVEKQNDEQYYGSDVCACLPTQKPLKQADPSAEATQKKSAEMEDRFHGAKVTVDGQPAEVVGEKPGAVIVMKTAAPDTLEEKQLGDLVVQTEEMSVPTAAMLVEQVGKMCGCYPREDRVMCCLFGQVKEVKYNNKEVFFGTAYVALKPHSCKDKDVDNISTDCVTRCREAEDLQDRSGCVVEGRAMPEN